MAFCLQSLSAFLGLLDQKIGETFQLTCNSFHLKKGIQEKRAYNGLSKRGDQPETQWSKLPLKIRKVWDYSWSSFSNSHQADLKSRQGVKGKAKSGLEKSLLLVAYVFIKEVVCVAISSDVKFCFVLFVFRLHVYGEVAKYTQLFTTNND